MALLSQWVTAGPWRVHLRRGGAGNPHPVVLVHGIVSSRYLVRTAEALAGHHYVIAPDLPGFGRSEKPAPAIGITDLADTLALTLEAVEVRSAVVVGHSIGAQIAVELALRYPRTVRGLVLVGPTGDPRVGAVTRMWGRWMATAPREPLAFLALTLWEAIRSRRAMLAMARSALNHEFRSALTRLDLPTLVVRGEWDRVAPQYWTDQVGKTSGAGETRVLPGVAHTVVFSAPSPLAALVAGFVTHLEAEFGGPAQSP